jgi:hypothetical protein
MIDNKLQDINEFVKQHNLLRKDPKSFIQKLDENKKYFRENLFAKPGENYMMTNEGSAGYDTAKEFLKTQKAVGSLVVDEKLNEAAKKHLEYIGQGGLVTHAGEGAKSVSERVEEFTEWEVSLGENLDFGTKDPTGILINLLVDDGVQARPHRKNLFNDTYQYVGVAIGAHKEYKWAAVIIYAGNLRKLNTPFYDFKRFKYQYPPELTEEEKKKAEQKVKTTFQLEDPDAPDNTKSVQTVKSGKLFNGRYHKITKKIYTLDDGSYHIVEVEDL